MMYFFETKSTKNNIVKSVLESYSKTKLEKTVKIYCDKCNDFYAKNFVNYTVIYHYPNIEVLSNDIRDEELCPNCFYETKMMNKINLSRKIY